MYHSSKETARLLWGISSTGSTYRVAEVTPMISGSGQPCRVSVIRTFLKDRRLRTSCGSAPGAVNHPVPRSVSPTCCWAREVNRGSGIESTMNGKAATQRHALQGQFRSNYRSIGPVGACRKKSQLAGTASNVEGLLCSVQSEVHSQVVDGAGRVAEAVSGVVRHG